MNTKSLALLEIDLWSGRKGLPVFIEHALKNALASIFVSQYKYRVQRFAAYGIEFFKFMDI